MRALSITTATVVLVCTHSAHAAPADDPFANTNCAKAQTQIELDYCANEDFEAADKKLNAVYRALLASHDAKNQAMLKTAERNWIAFRDSECTFETASSEGGSIQPMEYSLCLTDKTKARAKELESQRDCGEGDLGCNPRN